MALTDQATLAADATFKGRVQSAIVAAAIAIYNEAQATSGHGQRAAYAKAVLQNPAGYAAVMALGVGTESAVATAAGTPPVQAAVTDAQISNAVAGQWNAYAGV
jgi:hypothetical protein